GRLGARRGRRDEQWQPARGVRLTGGRQRHFLRDAAALLVLLETRLNRPLPATRGPERGARLRVDQRARRLLGYRADQPVRVHAAAARPAAELVVALTD